ncbi:hypothetical protein ZWY2020_042859 [Hordeum vulgare]|nr:hypothetical protein ZWY2020_042859 [Hordeum vulgare]
MATTPMRRMELRSKRILESRGDGEASARRSMLSMASSRSASSMACFSAAASPAGARQAAHFSRSTRRNSASLENRPAYPDSIETIVPTASLAPSRSRRSRREEEDGGGGIALLSLGDATVERFLKEIAGEKPIRFTPQQLSGFINNYSDRLGVGGFGSVYKGMLPNGLTVAVKRLHPGHDDRTSQEEFMVLVGTIGRTHHINVVRIFGFCYDADFGLARLLNRADTHKTVLGMRGTPEYATPEMWMQAGARDKCDVYSFGILLFEILGRRRNFDEAALESRQWFPKLAWTKYESGKLMEAMESCDGAASKMRRRRAGCARWHSGACSSSRRRGRRWAWW